MEHVETELARIEARLAAYPDPFEHAGLYAAQRALRPDACGSPYDVVTSTGGGSGDCSAESHPQPSSDTSDNTAPHVAAR